VPVCRSHHQRLQNEHVEGTEQQLLLLFWSDQAAPIERLSEITIHQ
jgi:hypothetical protein